MFDLNTSISPIIRKALSEQLIADYQRDGAVCIRSVIDEHWLSVLADGIANNLRRPGPQGREYTKDRGDAPGFFFGDAAVWQFIPQYQDFLFNSPVAEIAALLTGASKINLYFDGIFVRGPNTPSRTPWHQDVPYWPIEGDQMCTVWIPLDPVPREGSVEYVKGSHRWGKVFRPKSFFEAKEDYASNVEDQVPMPDFEQLRETYDLLGWEMRPGDVQCFHGHVIHGAAGNNTTGERRTFQARLSGDDMTYIERDADMHPVFPQCGLKPGDPIGGPMFPELWRREL